MTSLVAKFVLGRIFKESSENKQGREDPYFEYPAEELNKAGKRRSRRRKKALPPGITEDEGEILTKVKRRAYRLDMSLGSLLGIRFGWGSVIGIVPAIGDVLDAFLSLMVVKTAMKASLPTGLILHMIINVIFDFIIGIVPIIGDIIDAGYKCNTRNAVLLEKHLRQVGRRRLKEQGINNPEDDSLPGGYDTPPEDDVDLEAQAPRRRERERDATRPYRNGSTRRDDAPDRTGPNRSSDRPEMSHTRSLKKSRPGESRSSGSRRTENPRREGSRR